MITNPFYILTVFLGLISVALILRSKWKPAGKIPPVIWILILSALLANTGLIPTEHPFYSQLSGYAVPFAVCLVLFQIRLADIQKTGWPMLKTFAVASLGSWLGCVLAGILLRGPLDEITSGQGWKLAGPYIGTYIGGSLNFISMWTGLEIGNPELFAAANAVDNLTLIPIFIFWVLIPPMLKKMYPVTTLETVSDEKQNDQAPAILKLNDLILLGFIGCLIIVLSGLIKKYITDAWMPQIPSILFVTTLALLAAQFKSLQNLQGAKELGNFAFYLFFAAIGAMMDIPRAVCLAPVLFVYVVIIIVLQILFVLTVGRLLRMDLRMIAVASLAAKAGPSTVAAYTNTKNWNDLTLPGVAAGLLGYAIGNYAGLIGAYLLRYILM
jgi:uncharacterized membrane protein